MWAQDGGSVLAAQDGKDTTAWTGKPGVRLTLWSEQPMRALCLRWMVLPEEPRFAALVEGVWTDVPAPGARELWHLRLPLPEGATMVRVQDGAALGVSEMVPLYEDDPAQQAFAPPAEQADILIFAAHPDDDLLYFGGTIPLYARERGYAVQTVFLTNPSRLRLSEALAGQWTAGGAHCPVFGPFSDRRTFTAQECAADWGREKALAYLVENLRRFRPQAVLSHDPKGEYGHGAHMLLAQLLPEAAEAAADPSAYPDSAGVFGAWDTPKLYLHLYERNRIVMDWSVALPSMGGRTAIEVAREAYKCHVSQQGAGMDVRDRGIYSSTKFGLVRTRVGPDKLGGDFLENIPGKGSAP